MYKIRNFLYFGILVAIMELPGFAGNVTLAWNPDANPLVAGYNVYFWMNGGVSTNKVSVGNATMVTINNLVAGSTYLFAATTYDALGLESPFSSQISYTVPLPPTLNALYNLTVLENAGPQVVNLSGITTGATSQNQPMTVWASSSNPNVIPDPTVNYTSPNAAGSLSFAPATFATGTATITVNVNEGAGNNNSFSRTFAVTVVAYNDLSPPGDVILSPYASQQWTNGTFAVTGESWDNLAVATTYYSVNGGGWSLATTANNWLSWTGNVSLVPGMNTLQTYAVDTSGNRSLTNTVSFQYVVPKPLTVQIAGQGTVFPNYNGISLNVNQNYSMTATAAYGFAFTNWTDGAGHVLATQATLQFAMTTNLVLKANFVDTIKPTLTLLTPAASLRVSNVLYTVTGTASDNYAVQTVFYSLNGSAWTVATTGNKWTNWSAQIMLKPGTNTVRVFAADTGGNTSATNGNTINLVVPPAAAATLASSASGNGRFSFAVAGASGYKYVIQASSDLVNWVPIQTNIAPFTFVDTSAGQFNRRFYRSFFNP